MKIVITSGFYNPLHVGHLECLKLARELGDHLIAIVNNDVQVSLKGSKKFMSQADRRNLVSSIRYVDSAILSFSSSIDVCRDLEILRNLFPNDELIFAKGGDRLATEIPEARICKELNIEIIDGLGAKIRASSEILKDWVEETP